MKKFVSIACILCLLTGCQLTLKETTQSLPASAPIATPASATPTTAAQTEETQEPAPTTENQETAESSGIKTQAPAKENKSVTVYVTRTGHKYHREYCRFLEYSKIPVSLDAAKQTYEPCSVCRPPQ